MQGAEPMPLSGYLLTGGLVVARLLPVVAFTPLFGGEVASRRFRMGVTILLGLPLTLAIGPVEDRLGWLEMGPLLVKEAMIGATIALFVLILFQTLASTGALVDLARGATIASMLDPLSRQQTSILGVFLSTMGLVLFVSLGGYAMVMGALMDTFAICAPTDAAPERLYTEPTTGAIIGLMGELLLIAVRLAAPVIVVVLALDLGLGLVNRAAPQVQVFFLGMTSKGWLGLGAFTLTLSVTVGVVGGFFSEGMARVSSLLAPG